MSKIPYILATIHILLTLSAFGVIIADPKREHLIGYAILMLADLPWSIGFDQITYGIAAQKEILIVDFLFYITLGTIWWYWIGKVIIYVLGKIQRIKRESAEAKSE